MNSLKYAQSVVQKTKPPAQVLADYSSDALRNLIVRQHRAEPIIEPKPSHRKAFAKTNKTPKWKAIYNRRTSIEQLNGRLKGFRKLSNVPVGGRFKVRVYAMLAVIVCQAPALATGSRASVRGMLSWNSG